MKNCSDIKSLNAKCTQYQKGIDNTAYVIPIECLEIINGVIVGIKELPLPKIKYTKAT